MRIQPSGLIDFASGKYRDLVFSTNKGSASGTIQTVKSYTKPYNPNTVDQQAIRNCFKFASRAYLDSVLQTIGASTIGPDDMHDNTIDALATLKVFGIQTAGTGAGKQLWIAVFVANRAQANVAQWLALDQIPGEFLIEAEIINALAAIAYLTPKMFDYVQAKKIGFLEFNPGI